MKTMSTLLVIVVCSASLSLLGGCGKKTVPPYTDQDKDKAKTTSSGDTKDRTGSITEEITPGTETLDDNGQTGRALGGFSVSSDQDSEEYKKTYGRSSSDMLPVYFNFDQAGIRGDQQTRLERNGDYMKNNPSRNLVIEGNSDERGTNEYNLALGERRALNAKNYLIELGVEEYRMRSLSYGEERPLFPGQTDFDWSQNRRDDFILE